MQKLRALIVEDNLQLNLIFSLALQSDFDITRVEDGRSAIQALEQDVPDLVVLDLQLPEVSGDVVLEFIRSSERYASVQVILATADFARAEALSAQADLVLLKPISPLQLKDLAARLMVLSKR